MPFHFLAWAAAAALSLTMSFNNVAATTLESRTWMLQAFEDDGIYTGRHWILGELSFFASADCSGEPMTSASNLNRSIYDCCDEDNPQCSPNKARVTNDGASPSALAVLTQNTPVANLSAVTCNTDTNNTFAACSAVTGDPHYIGYTFNKAEMPKCVRISQAKCTSHFVEKMCLVGWDAEANKQQGNWKHYGDLTFTSADGENVTVVSVSNPNPNCTINPDLNEEYKDPIISDGSSDTELSPTELAIVIVVVLIAGCLIGCLGMWYWRKKQNQGISQPSKTVELNAMP
mmetsp:Transcript_29747/g.57174  ORF Transcript_29747/g.57174 Transcript_29747/m.57174 type:complete len:288 (-) Transcript_29747:254-1117(-)